MARNISDIRERVGDVLVVGEVEAGAHPVQIGASAEALARALQHDRTDVVGLAQPLEGALNLSDKPLVEGIVQVRTIQRDDGGESVPGEAQMLVGVFVPGLARRFWLAHTLTPPLAGRRLVRGATTPILSGFSRADRSRLALLSQ